MEKVGAFYSGGGHLFDFTPAGRGSPASPTPFPNRGQVLPPPLGPLFSPNLTRLFLIEAVHAGEVNGQGFEGGGQAEATLRTLHEQPRTGGAAGGFGRRLRFGQLRRPILHSEYSPRRLGC